MSFKCIACLEPLKEKERLTIVLAPGKSLWIKDFSDKGIWCFWCAEINTGKRNARLAMKAKGKK